MGQSFLERHFITLAGIPVVIAALCIGYAAFASRTVNLQPAPSAPFTTSATDPTLENSLRTPVVQHDAPSKALTPPLLAPPIIIQPAATIRPMRAPAILERREVAINTEPAPEPALLPAKPVAPDPEDAPYIVPGNKPYLVTGQNETKPAQPNDPAKSAPGVAKPGQAVATPAANNKDERRIDTKTFVLKDGRRIPAAIVSDQGDSYSVEDSSGHSEEFLKSDVHLIISRR